MAPDELSKNWNTVSGETKAITTDTKPNTVQVKIARTGTPLPVSLSYAEETVQLNLVN